MRLFNLGSDYQKNYLAFYRKKSIQQYATIPTEESSREYTELSNTKTKHLRITSSSVSNITEQVSE